MHQQRSVACFCCRQEAGDALFHAQTAACNLAELHKSAQLEHEAARQLTQQLQALKQEPQVASLLQNTSSRVATGSDKCARHANPGVSGIAQGPQTGCAGSCHVPDLATQSETSGAISSVHTIADTDALQASVSKQGASVAARSASHSSEELEVHAELHAASLAGSLQVRPPAASALSDQAC